jgi:hypothetical protein
MVRCYSRSVRTLREPRPIGDGACQLELTLGKFAVIDEADAELVCACNWYASENRNGTFYAKGKPHQDGRNVRMHRFILGYPGDQVDHINHDTLDNRRSNLRIVTQSQNLANTPLRKSSQTGFKGVTVSGRGFVAAHRGDHLGTFRTAIEAALAYDAAAIAHFGTFAATNASLGLLSEDAS